MSVRESAIITDIRTVPVSIPVRQTLLVTGARGTHDRSDFLLVRVATSVGIDGYGEVSATLLWSGEDAGTAQHVIERAIAPALIGRPLEPVEALDAEMDRVLARSQFTKAGVSIALWDAYSRLRDLPMAEVLGDVRRRRIPVKCSLSGNGERLATGYTAARAAGFTSFKVKIGLDLDTDVARLREARELAGPDAFLGLDANGGYSRVEAVRAIREMAPYGPAFLEQPVQPRDLDGMRELRGRGLRIVADESVFDMEDLLEAVRREAADVISIYVGKSGGPMRAVDMAWVAAENGLAVVLGSNGELGIGAAAQLQVAAVAPGLSDDIPSDIIGAHYYDDDIVVAPYPGDGTFVELPDGPGLGVIPRPELVEQLGGTP